MHEKAFFTNFYLSTPFLPPDIFTSVYNKKFKLEITIGLVNIVMTN